MDVGVSTIGVFEAESEEGDGFGGSCTLRSLDRYPLIGRARSSVGQGGGGLISGAGLLSTTVLDFTASVMLVEDGDWTDPASCISTSALS